MSNIDTVKFIASKLKPFAKCSPTSGNEVVTQYLAAIAILQGIENTKSLSDNVVVEV